ncbi:uncharacterized protein LDX57_003252 [Aspergillus melleus]|uniref:uncharacterized protein n=1 Tax=Aspergillus melleus TaxID=138277 RepID=UPI001E8D9396|nr:uncharacterized protein LDX57_003252 [Aspergillus melleus]KAH8425501.1 hypothetical protein LDX57_003252 [Aspergillus melleus]
MEEWVKPYNDERNRGHATLQRRRRLMQLPSVEPKEAHHDSSPQEAPPDYSTICGLSDADWTNEIRTLTAAF